MALSTMIPLPGQEGAAVKAGVRLPPVELPGDFAQRTETLRQINLFIRTRWCIALGCLAVLVLGTQTGALTTPPMPPLLTLLTIALYNIAFQIDHRWCVRAGEDAELDRVFRSAYVHIHIDLVALSALVYFTGGPYSPFALLYVLHTVTAAFLLSRFDTFVQAALALVLFAAVGAVHASSPDWANVSTGPWGTPTLAYTSTVLAGLALMVFGVAWLGTHLVQRNREATDWLRERVNTDGLTGLFSYGYFAGRLDIEMARARRFEHPLSLVLIDMDGLKAYNDAHGHLMGSRALQEIAAILKDCSRAVDIPSRYGGDEFALILPETPKAGAAILAERICVRVRERSFMPSGNERTGRLSVSSGVSAFPEDSDNIWDVLGKADTALYEAKRGGKDRVKVVGQDRFLGVRPPHPA